MLKVVSPQVAASPIAMPERCDYWADSWVPPWLTPPAFEGRQTGWRNAPARCRKASSASSNWWMSLRKASGWPMTGVSSTYVNQRMADLLGHPSGSMPGPADLRFYRAVGSRSQGPSHVDRRGPRAPRRTSGSAGGTGASSGARWPPARSWERRRSRGNRRDGHRHHRAEAGRGSPPPHGGPPGAARYGPGDRRGPLAGRGRAAALLESARLVPCHRCTVVLFDFAGERRK